MDYSRLSYGKIFTEDNQSVVVLIKEFRLTLQTHLFRTSVVIQDMFLLAVDGQPVA